MFCSLFDFQLQKVVIECMFIQDVNHGTEL